MRNIRITVLLALLFSAMAFVHAQDGTKEPSSPDSTKDADATSDEMAGLPRQSGVPDPGLQWLADHQNSDGYWSAADYIKDSTRTKDGAKVTGIVDFNQARSKDGDQGADLVITGLSVLALVGDGSTHTDGKFKATVSKATTWIVGTQDDDGCFGPRAGIYVVQAHSICTQAIVELSAMTMDRKLKGVGQKAIDFIINNQEPGFNWRKPADDAKEIVPTSAWVVLAMKAASLAEIAIPNRQEIYDAINERLTQVIEARDRAEAERKIAESDETKAKENRKKGKGRDKRRRKKRGSSKKMKKVKDEEKVDPYAVPLWPGSIAITSAEPAAGYHLNPCLDAAAIVIRLFTGHSKPDDPALADHARRLLAAKAVWEREKIDFTYWFFGSMAFFQMGDKYWDQWADPLAKPILLNYQRGANPKDVKEFGKEVVEIKDNEYTGRAKLDEFGSWDPVDAWSTWGGRVYATALNTMSLQVYRRYARMNR